MRVIYHPESDSMWIKLDPDNTYDESEEVAPGQVLDFDKEGNLIAIEIYKDASKRVDLSVLATRGMPTETRPAPEETERTSGQGEDADSLKRIIWHSVPTCRLMCEVAETGLAAGLESEHGAAPR